MSCMANLPGPDQRQLVDRIDEPRVDRRRAFRIELERRYAVEPFHQQIAQLEPGQMRTEAAMDAGAERDGRNLAVENDLLWISEDLAVEIGRRDEEMDTIAGLEVDAVIFGISCHAAKHR